VPDPAAEHVEAVVANNSHRKTAIVGPEVKPYMKSTLLDKRIACVVTNDAQKELDNDDATHLTPEEARKRAAKREKNKRSHDKDKERRAAIKYGLSTSTSRMWAELNSHEEVDPSTCDDEHPPSIAAVLAVFQDLVALNKQTFQAQLAMLDAQRCLLVSTFNNQQSVLASASEIAHKAILEISACASSEQRVRSGRGGHAAEEEWPPGPPTAAVGAEAGCDVIPR